LEVVLAEVLCDDFREQLEVRLSHDIKARREMYGLPQRPAHVDVTRVEVLDHEHRAWDAIQRIENLPQVGDTLEEFILNHVHGNGGMLPFFDDLAIDSRGIAA
jgi:hypothetical protein